MSDNSLQKNMYDSLKIRNEERQTIGRELHDVISNDLLKLQFQLLALKDEIEPTQFQDVLNQADLIRRQIRTISHRYVVDLCENTENTKLDSLKEKIKESLIDTTYLHPHLNFHYLIYPKKDQFNFPKIVVETLIICVREIIFNAIQHGEADEIEVNMTKHAENTVLMISDNGIGFDKVDTKKKGIGLKNIKARMEQLSGSVVVDTAPNFGTTITLKFPFNKY